MSNKLKVRTSSFFGAEVTTTISIFLVLFLLGLALFIVSMGHDISAFVKENMSITIELNSSTTNRVSLSSLRNQLDNSPYVKSVTFISKEDIKKELIKDLGNDPDELLGYTPSSDYFEVHLKSAYANMDSIKVVENKLKGQTLIKNFIYSEDTMRIINTNLSRLGIVLMVLVLILMLISFTLIMNTIRLNIYSKRFLINTMRLVGATDGFIRRPFTTRALISGLIAALFADIALTALIYSLSGEFPEIMEIVNPVSLLFIYAIVIIFGAMLTYLATCFAVNRYLRMETNNLYYI